MSELKYIAEIKPNKIPCLMQNTFGDIFLVTKQDTDAKYFVTLISGGIEEMNTWESDLKAYKPVSKGARFEFVN